MQLKKMAMQMRHHQGGLQFNKKSATGLGEPLNKTAEPTAPMVTKSRSVVMVDGPDNILGLKTIFMHPFSVLLLAVPLGIMSPSLGWSDSWTFWLNFLALVPLAKILGDATEELAESLKSDTISGLLNATFGNAVEMIVSIQAIRSGLLSVVKNSLLGSIISNILLVLGTAFLVGGLSSSPTRSGRFHHIEIADDEVHKFGYEKEQLFPVKGAAISISMLMVACMSFCLPSIFSSMPGVNPAAVLEMSRIGAVIVGSTYVGLMLFQLVTHTRTLSKEEDELGEEGGHGEGEASEAAGTDEDDEGSSASLTVSCAIGLMFVTTLVVAYSSEFLVDSIEHVVKQNGIPQSFIGVILLPLAGNACEHAGAIRFAYQDRPGLAIGIAVGSSTQVALLVVPFSVVVAWYFGQPLDLNFGALSAAVVTLSVLVLSMLIQDGRSNWLKGYILICLYVFIAVLYWFVPMAEERSVAASRG